VEVEAAWALAEQNAAEAIATCDAENARELGKRIVRLCRALADIASGAADERRINAKKRTRAAAIAIAKRR
jgi:hypothetical protein